MAAEAATFAGGCFWCLEAVFERIEGVRRVVSGYTGGHVRNPGYREVCGGTTGHAEAIQVEFDSAIITYEDLLEIFFAFHDPTTLNRQGPDQGTQYRSAIFCHDDDQRASAEAVIKRLEDENVFERPIVTEVGPLTEFFPAESYHQEYYRRNSGQAYCQAWIAPKVAKLRARYSARLKPVQ